MCVGERCRAAVPFPPVAQDLLCASRWTCPPGALCERLVQALDARGVWGAMEERGRDRGKFPPFPI